MVARDQGEDVPATEVRVACDVGTVRIGMARCDPDAVLATALPTILAGPDSLVQVVAVAAELGAVEIVVGLPLRLNGSRGPAAEQAASWAAALEGALSAAGLSTPVRLLDERLTTVQAQRGLHAAGRNTRTSRQRIDSAAAVVLLQGYLDQRARRRTGGTP